MTEAVIFDMDGLLIDSEPFWRKAEIQGFSEVGITLTEEDCMETMGYRLNEVVDLWYSRQSWEGKSKKEVELRILQLVIHYIKTEGKALPGVFDTLEMCKSTGLKMAIASSSPMVLINAVIERLGIGHYFEVVHSAEFEQFGKPHPVVFMTTAEKLQVLPKDCLVFEDSFHGIVAGLAAKMKVIGVPDKSNFTLPKYQAAHVVLPSLEGFTKNHLVD